MRRAVVPASATLLLAALWWTAPALAEPAPVPPLPPPVPAPPPALAGLDPALLIGPLDQLTPVTLLAPDRYRLPDGSQPSPYVLSEGAPPGPFAFIDELKGVHAMLHGALGRLPGSELGAALPGTAPPPGSNLPPGLEQFLPVPPPVPAPVPTRSLLPPN